MNVILDSLSNPLGFIISFLAIVMAITVHEFAHAFAADRLGDPTPRLQGRLTLDPRAHLDPLGTLMIVLVRFGWGKPVEFDPFNLRHPRRDAAIISIAGPISNIILATVSSIIFRILLSDIGFTLSTIVGDYTLSLVIGFLTSLITINVVLAIFNLVPIHPLDGFKIVGGILPEETARQWYELERYGFIFLIFLLLPITGGAAPISRLIGPPINFLLNILLPSAPFI
jgi:Zn-dependent protease